MLIICVNILFSNITIATAPDLVSAFIVNHSLVYGHERVNNSLKHPLLSYQNRTYISLRDMAQLSDMNITWDSGLHSPQITMYPKKASENVVDSYEVAFKIAESVIKSKYSGRVNNNTQYVKSMTHMNIIGFRETYNIYVKFDCEPGFDLEQQFSKNDSVLDFYDLIDLEVVIHCDNGEITINELGE